MPMLGGNASMTCGCVIPHIKHLKLIEYVYCTPVEDRIVKLIRSKYVKYCTHTNGEMAAIDVK